MTSEPARLPPTPSQTVGPFFHFCLGADARGGCLATPQCAGEQIRFRVRVLDGDGVPVPDALIELYQADADGKYPDAQHATSSDVFCGFGRMPTDERGACEFRTIRPGLVSDERTGRQASHINVCVFARGLLRHLYTRAYFARDPDIATDPLLSAVAPSRRETLLALPGDRPGAWTFEIRLQGDRETVFFDL
jgi:protocatechuate 3,4-dioxygenase alpha subunit